MSGGFECLARRALLLSGLSLGASVVVVGCSSGVSKDEIEVAKIPLGGVAVTAHFVVAQPKAGVFQAWSNICPHKGATINLVEGKEAVCPFHGSRFDGLTGEVLQGPAKTNLVPAIVQRQGDKLIVITGS